MQRLTPQINDTGGLEVVAWIDVTPTGETEPRSSSYLPCKSDRFHRGRHRAPIVYTGREIPSWLIGVVATLWCSAVLVTSWTAGLL